VNVALPGCQQRSGNALTSIGLNLLSIYGDRDWFTTLNTIDSLGFHIVTMLSLCQRGRRLNNNAQGHKRQDDLRRWG
jgi:hypothetical protein